MLLNPAERDPIKTADWAEHKALCSPSGSVALEVIRSDIDVDGTVGNDEETESLPHELSERLVASATAEIRRRAYIAKDAYPFTLSEGMLQADNRVDFMPYIFCLLLADRESYSLADQESVKLFEHLVCKAVNSYLRGSSTRFGVPRDTMPQGIHDAISQLANITGNRKLSDGYPVNANDKDLGLDVVAWKEFPDRYPGKIELYVQCTTGQHWEGKKHDCDLEEWRGIIYWPFYPTKGLAIPYVVSESDWERETAGVLLMDRLRLSYLLKGCEGSDDGYDWWAWCGERITEISQQP